MPQDLLAPNGCDPYSFNLLESNFWSSGFFREIISVDHLQNHIRLFVANLKLLKIIIY